MRRRALAFLALAALWAAPAGAVSLGREPEGRPAPPPAPRVETPKAAASDYEKVHELFLKGDYAAAAAAAEAYLADPRARDSDAVLHIEALCLIKLGKGSAAREKLRRLERTAAGNDRRAAAIVSTGDSYFEDGIFASAHESYKRALEKYPDAGDAPYVRRRLTESAERMASRAPVPSRLGQHALEEKPFFAVQVGSFGSEQNARALEKKLRAARFDAYVETAERRWRVRVGRLDSREEAASLETKLREKGYPTKIVP